VTSSRPCLALQRQPLQHVEQRLVVHHLVLEHGAQHLAIRRPALVEALGRTPQRVAHVRAVVAHGGDGWPRLR
jgi:hypothetical protein